MNIKGTKKGNKEDLLSKKNVWAVGIGYKESRNPFKKIINKIKKLLGVKSIRVYVTHKELPKDLLEKDFIPKRVDGCRTDVVPEPPVKHLNEYRSKHRPVKTGVSMCNAAGTACTSGFPVWKIEDGEIIRGAQVNNHCQTRYGEDKVRKGDPVIQPSLFDEGDPENDQVAEVYEWYPRSVDKINDMDSGMNKFIDGHKMTHEMVSKEYVPEMGEVKLGDIVWKEGRTTGYTEAEVIDTDVTVRVNSSEGVLQYEGQFFTKYMLGGGDSSSAIMKKSNNKIVGQGFCGTDNISGHCPIQPIVEYFDLYLTREDAEEELEEVGWGYVADGWNDVDWITVFDDSEFVETRVNTFWGMRVRKNPSTNSEIIGKIKRGETIKVYDVIQGDDYTWLKIKV